MQALVEQGLDHLRGAWRFRWRAMTAAWVICIVGWLVVLYLPDVYEASARVFVDTRTALSPVIEGLAIGQDVDAQLNFVQKSLLGEAQIERVAREANLDLHATTPQSRHLLLDRLRQRIQLEAAGGGGRDATGVVFTLRYKDPVRDRSLRVTSILLNSFIEDTLGGKRTGTEVAQKFLQEQIEDREMQLRSAEQRLADFKKRNVGMMPGAQGDYFSNLQAEIDATQKAQAALAIAAKRRSELERQLRGEAPSLSDGSMIASGGGAGEETSARIKETQTKLDELLLKYTDKHPEVLALRETLAGLEQRRNEEIEALRRGEIGSAAQTGASANPVFQSIQLASNQTDVEIAAIRAEIVERQRKVAELRHLVNTVPEVEAEFARLNRDYEVTRSQYTALVDRLEKAKLGEQAAATSSVRFEVIDPPNAAFRPVSPNRLMLMTGVLLCGLAVGGGVAYLMVQLKPVFLHSRSLGEVTGLPILGVVSVASLEPRGLKNRIDSWGYSAAFIGLLMSFAAVMRFHDAGSRLVRLVVGTSGFV